ncbi:MAG TPA: adenosine kinase [Chitinispirillaceae bacterium]|nr:adenosine kinase [Chitinispirillaceae bacterium]
MKLPFKTESSRNKIAAVGSALVDICLLEEENFLAQTGGRKGGMVLVDNNFIQQTLKKSNREPVIVPGGSACNTILGVGKLGAATRFIGKRGDDELGKLFENGLLNHNVEPVLMKSKTPTGHVLSVITPDAQRSMFSYLGAAAETSPEEISPALFSDCAIVHLEGYLLFNEKLMMAALEAAKTAGAYISLDLASFTVVEAAHSLLEKITENYVDILIANEDEARTFTGHKDELKALQYLAQKASIAVLKVGKRGSYIASKAETLTINAMGDGSAIDTTGAGDLWAAGFLFGLLKGFPLKKCGELGSACGFEVCQVIGASIPEQGYQRIRSLF